MTTRYRHFHTATDIPSEEGMSRGVAHLEDYLSDVNVSAKLVATSIQNKLLPIAHQMKEESLRNDTKLSSDSGSVSETLSEVNLSSVQERSLSLLEKEEISVSIMTFRCIEGVTLCD